MPSEELSRSAPSGSATFDALTRNNNGGSMRSIPVSIRASSPLLWPFTMLPFSRFETTNDDSRSPKLLNLSKHSHDTVIKLNTNNLIEIPNKMHLLKQVEELRLTRNIYKTGDGLQNIPQSISSLNKLKILDLRGNPLNGVPLSVCNLKNLTELNLESCNILSMPLEITSLTSLNRLSLDNNKIKDPELYYFSTVKYLSIVNNGIQSVRAILPAQMVTLDMSENFLESLKETFFHDSCCLEKLYLRENLLTHLPASISKLPKLKVLDVSKNEIGKLQESICQLKSLIFFNISYNALTALPKSVTNLTGMENSRFLCGENPLQKPPIEVAIKGLKSIQNYFDALDNSTEANCKRLKLMVLGDPDAGKTSLAEAIVSCQAADAGVNIKTIGIDFFHWKEQLPDTDEMLDVMIVDCAGEKKYLLTHQLFLSVGMLFTVIVDLSKYKRSKKYFEDKIGYWMNLIVAKVPNAVIMIVPTHLDLVTDHYVVIQSCKHMIQCAHEHIKERQHIIEKGYDENVKKPPKPILPVLPRSYQLEVDGKTETEDVEPGSPTVYLIPISSKQRLPGLNLLRHEIIRIACDVTLSPNVNRYVPKTWLDLEHVCFEERSKRPVLTVDELSLKAQGFRKKRDISEALEYIDSVGPILYFHTNSDASDIVFLDPKWLLQLLKLVFRHDLSDAYKYEDYYATKYDMFEVEFRQAVEVLSKSALLSKKLLRCIWNNNITDGLFNEVIQLFQKCDLAYDMELLSSYQDKNSLLVPWFLQDYCPIPVEPDENKMTMITLIETRGGLPDGFFQRFIIKVYSLNVFNHCTPWNYGFKGLNKDGEVVCKFEKFQNSSRITLQGFSDPKDIYHLWLTIIPILQVLERFIKEWKGVSPGLFSLCPGCFVTKKDNPRPWRLDLSMLHQNEAVLSCDVESKTIDKWLIFPPYGMMLNFIDKQNKTHELENYLSGELSLEDKDSISGLMADRCEELRKALKIDAGQLPPIGFGTNYRERAYEIINLWEQQNQSVSRELFITALSEMHPYPYKAANILLKGT